MFLKSATAVSTALVVITAASFLYAGVSIYDVLNCDKTFDELCSNPFEGDDAAFCIACSFVIGAGPLSQSLPPVNLPIHFEPNLGQAASGYSYLADGDGVTALLSGKGIRLRPESGPTIDLALSGANPLAEASGEDPLPGRVNYLLGNDPSKWITHVPVYRKVRFREVYPGIDAVYYGTGRELEHDFIVSPGADPSVIRMSFAGADSVTLDGSGGMRIAAGKTEFVWRKPAVYQRQRGTIRPIEAAYRLDGGVARFELGPYNPDLPLVIDPVVSYASYFGRAQADAAARAVTDASGNLFFTGATRDNAFPVTPGALTSRASASPGNAIVTKVNADGSAMVYTTHFGGTSIDLGLGLAIDGSGNLYVAGLSLSDDFPTTPGAVQPRLLTPPGGRSDPASCFVAKLSADGSRLEYATFLGGLTLDACTGIAVDSAGNAYVSGVTDSRDFPVTQDAAQISFGGAADGFVAKLNNNATRILYATFLGGNAWDGVSSIAIDAQGQAHVAGCTSSTRGIPITGDARQRTYGGGGGGSGVNCGDAFVGKLNAAGTAFSYLTYHGGARDDVAMGLALDTQGNAYVAGYTLSENFPVSAGAYQTTNRGTSTRDKWNSGDAFVTKFSPTGALVYSTYLGGSSDEKALAIAVDAAGQAWITGNTVSGNFPVTQDATQRTFGGLIEGEAMPTGDAFAAQLNGAGTALVFSTYLGGRGNEIGIGIAVDPAGSAYVTGATSSPNFPVSPQAIQREFAGARNDFLPLGDIFLAKYGSTSAAGVTIASIASAASYVGNGVVPGEIAVLTGTRIGPERLAVAQATSSGFATSFSGLRVTFDGTPAPVLYALNGQSSVIVPYGIAGRQSVSVVAEYQGERSPSVNVPVLAAKPGIFTQNSSGTGPGAILNQDFSLNTAANPAAPGTVVQIFATGDGVLNPQPLDGSIIVPPLPLTTQLVSVTIGGLSAPLFYSGAAPGSVAGLWQVNAGVPANAPSGALPVVIRAGAAQSQPGVTVSIR
jgi:uncharacterized protein (TIGR03437 family)